MKRKPLPSNLPRPGWLLASLLPRQLACVVSDGIGADVSQNTVVIESSIRYNVQEVVVESRSVVNIALSEDVYALKLLVNYKSPVCINEPTDSQKTCKGSIPEVINHWVNNDYLKGWTPGHPEDFYDLTETKTLNQNLC